MHAILLRRVVCGLLCRIVLSSVCLPIRGSILSSACLVAAGAVSPGGGFYGWLEISRLLCHFVCSVVPFYSHMPWDPRYFDRCPHASLGSGVVLGVA